MTVEKNKKNSLFKEFFVKYFKIITLLTTVAILVLGVLFILKPKYNKVSTAGALNVEAKREELTNKRKYVDKLKKLQSNYKKLSDEDIIKLNFALPKEEDIPNLLAQLENLSRMSGFNLLSVDISSVKNVRGKVKRLKNTKKLNIALTLGGGNYSALKSLLKEIELNLRLFDVDSLNFTAESDLYTLNMSTYYYSAK